MSWKDQYEHAAGQELQAYENQSIDALLRAVQQGQFGQYNMIWTALSDQATLDEAGWVLFGVLQQDKLDYLIRCNCAEALLELLERDDVLAILDEATNLSRGSAAQQTPYLHALRLELCSRIGEPPAH